MSAVLLVILIMLFLGAMARWNCSRDRVYGSSGGLRLIVLILIVLPLMGRI